MTTARLQIRSIWTAVRGDGQCMPNEWVFGSARSTREDI